MTDTIWLVYYSLDGSGGQGDFVLERAGWFSSEKVARRWIENEGETGNYWPEPLKRARTERAKNDKETT